MPPLPDWTIDTYLAARLTAKENPWPVPNTERTKRVSFYEYLTPFLHAVPGSYIFGVAHGGTIESFEFWQINLDAIDNFDFAGGSGVGASQRFWQIRVYLVDQPEWRPSYFGIVWEFAYLRAGFTDVYREWWFPQTVTPGMGGGTISWNWQHAAGNPSAVLFLNNRSDITDTDWPAGANLFGRGAWFPVSSLWDATSYGPVAAAAMSKTVASRKARKSRRTAVSVV